MDADSDGNFQCGAGIPFVWLLLLPWNKPYFFETYNLQVFLMFSFSFFEDKHDKIQYLVNLSAYVYLSATLHIWTAIENHVGGSGLKHFYETNLYQVHPYLSLGNGHVKLIAGALFWD